MRVKEENSLPKRKKTNRFLCSLCAIFWPWLNARNPAMMTVRTMPEIIMNIENATITSIKVNPVRDTLAFCRLPIVSNGVKAFFLILSRYSAPAAHFRLQALTQAPSRAVALPNQTHPYSNILYLNYNKIQIVLD